MNRFWICLWLLAALHGVSSGPLLAQDQPASPQKTGEVASKLSGAQRKVLEDDIDRAIKLLQEKQMATFFEDYSPVEGLRMMRAEKLDAKKIDRSINHDHVASLVTLLQQAKAGLFAGDDNEVAVLQKLSDEPVKPEPIPIAQPLQDVKEVTGYGADFPKALAAGIADLKAKKFEAFLQAMLPASEVARLVQTDQLKMTASVFTLYPEMATAMIADLEAISQKKPQPEKELVTVKLPGQIPESAEREIRFQLSGGHWRFFDQAQEMDATLHPLLDSQEKIDAFVAPIPILTFERIRDHWRIKDWPRN